MSQHPPIQKQKALLVRISEGDVTAFRILFDTYNKRLYAAILKITKSSCATEDLVQEIFTTLWERREGLANVGAPDAYIFTVAYNRTFRYLKKVASDKNKLQLIHRFTPSLHNSTEEWMDFKETKELLDKAIERLPPKRRLILRMSREQGLSHKEIAEQLQISPHTVKKQIVVALRAIRTFLSEVAPLLALLF